MNIYSLNITKDGRPPKFEKPEDMQAKIDQYYMSLQLSDDFPTVTGLALYLGFASRQSMYDYKSKGEFSYIIKRALCVIENEYEKKLSGNNTSGAIFALKNMEWKDKTELGHSFDDEKVDLSKLSKEELVMYKQLKEKACERTDSE